jgi:hypothetical protein
MDTVAASANVLDLRSIEQLGLVRPTVVVNSMGIFYDMGDVEYAFRRLNSRLARVKKEATRIYRL